MMHLPLSKTSLPVFIAVVVGQSTFCWAQIDPNAVSIAQNDFYGVNVVDHDVIALDSVGSYQAHTGGQHPAGADRDINYASGPGGINIGTSFSGLRVNGGNAYTMDMHGGGAASSVNNLDPYFSNDEPTPGHAGTGWRTRWDLFDEQLEIVQDFIVVGDSADHAAIYHTVEIINGRGEAVGVEWINLMDSDLESDAGPSNTIVHANGFDVTPTLHRETQHVGKPDEMVKISDSSGGGSYDVFWSLSYDPGFEPDLQGTPLKVTPPDSYQFVQWATAYDPANFSIPSSVFDYAIDPTKVITGEGGPIDDSAGIAKFSATIPGNGSARFTQVIFARQVPEPQSAVLLLLGCMFAVAAQIGRSGR